MARNRKILLQISEDEIEELAEGLVELTEAPSPPIDLRAIARLERPAVRIRAGHYAAAFDGHIRYHKGRFVILYNTKHGTERTPRVRFTIGHELGHFFLDQHRQKLVQGDHHLSKTDFATNNSFEREADLFAAALLLPRERFRRQIRSVEPDMQAVKACAEEYGTSRTSTAIRFTKLTDYPCALICSNQSDILWSMSSSMLRDLCLSSLRWKGDGVPTGTATFGLASDPDRVRRAELMEERGDMMDWAARPDTGREIPAWEQAIGLGECGRILTLVSVDENG